MRLLAYFRSLAAKFFHPAEVARDVDEELLSHIQHRADDLERSGLLRAEAERRARIEFGGQERVAEECHEALGGNFIETLISDVRFSCRVLRKSPGFTVTAVLTLALAIGANAVVFSLVNGIILHPLDVPHPDSLYALEHASDNLGNLSYPDYLELHERNRSFDGLAAYRGAQAGLDTGKDSSRVWLEEVTGNYFDILGIQPYLGHFFHTSDEHGPNSAPYIVLPNAYWHSHFQDDPGVVGRVVQVDKHPFTILGIAPPGFNGTLMFFHPDLFLPMVNQAQLDGEDLLNTRAKRLVFEVMGHLKPGVTPAQAIADLNSIGGYLEKTYPNDERQMTFRLARPNLYGDYLGRPVRGFLAVMTLLTGLILLAACANLGSLFAARAADRSREVALRLALGAGRKHILRQLFTEALLISLIGGTVGLLGSVVLLRELRAWQPVPRFPIHVQVNPDANVYGVALLLALASGFLFGAVPVRQVLRTNPYEIVKAGSTGIIAGSAGRRITVRDLLLVVQIAICAVLVTSSFVAVQGLARSLHSNFGFDPENVLLADTDLAMAGYTDEQAPEIQKRMIDAVQALPGVESVGLADAPPLAGRGWRAALVFSDKTTDLKPSNAAVEAVQYRVSPEYLHAAGTSLLAGRAFSWHDDMNSPRVAVVNREFARKIFGSVNSALGSYYKTKDGTRILVVGVAEDGKYTNLTEDPKSTMFLPVLQSPTRETWLVVRSRERSKERSVTGANRDPQQLTAAIRSTLRSLDAGLPFYIQSWTKELDSVLFPSRAASVSLGVLGMMGAMLSVTGIFGMAAYSVSKRLRELGIRIALGAQRREVLQAALGRAVKLLAFGSAAGLFLGILATRVLAYIVYQANPRDPLVLAGVVLSMSLLGLLATWIPAQRALSVDPLIMLREE